MSFRSAPLRRDLLALDPFAIVGRRARAAGRADRGISDLEFDGVPALHDLHVEHSVFERGAITSLGLERTIRSGNSVVTEHSLVLPEVSALTIEWTADVGTSISLTWRHEAPLTARSIEWNTSADGLIVRYGSGESLACIFSMPHVMLNVIQVLDRVRRTAAITVSARIPVAAPGTRMHIVHAPVHAPPLGAAHGGAQTAAQTAAPPEAVPAMAATLGVLRNVLPLSRSLTAVQVRRAHAGISIASPDPQLDDAVEWAKQRIAVAPFEQARPVDAFANALAALGANDAGVARGMIARVADTPADYLIALARYFAWSGDAPFVGMEWDRVQAAVHELLRIGPDHEAALWTTALAEIGAVAADVGQSELAGNLDSVVRRERIAHAGALRQTHWLDALPHPATAAWLHLANGEDARALRRIDAAATRAFSILADPATILLPLSLGLLGLEPDATRARLRMRPRFPAAWDHIDVRGIPVGDASVSMRWRRRARTHEFRMRQDSGPVPLRLIFEPLLPGAPLLDATVDGVAATLDARPHAGRMLVPVQVVLDEERVITFTTGG